MSGWGSKRLGGQPPRTKKTDEFLLLAEKIPDSIWKRVLERPDVFRKIAALDDMRLDEIVEFLDQRK